LLACLPIAILIVESARQEMCPGRGRYRASCGDLRATVVFFAANFHVHTRLLSFLAVPVSDREMQAHVMQNIF